MYLITSSLYPLLTKYLIALHAALSVCAAVSYHYYNAIHNLKRYPVEFLTTSGARFLSVIFVSWTSAHDHARVVEYTCYWFHAIPLINSYTPTSAREMRTASK